MTPPLVDALQRVGERHAQDGAIDCRAPTAALRQAAMSAGRTKGRAASWMATRSGGCGGQRFQAVQHRMLAAGTASRPAAASSKPATAASVVRFVAGTDHDLDPVDARGRLEDRQGAAQDRLPV